MDDNSFIGPTKGMQKVMTKSESAYVQAKEAIFGSDEYKNCMIDLIPWQQRIGANAMILQKSSPYEPFMKQVILDLYSSGILKQLQQKWSITDRNCEMADNKPISPQKVFVCFIWILCGMVTSLITLIVERQLVKFWKNSNPTDKTCMKNKIESFVDDVFIRKSCSDEELIQMIAEACKDKCNERLN